MVGHILTYYEFASMKVKKKRDRSRSRYTHNEYISKDIRYESKELTQDRINMESRNKSILVLLLWRQ